MTATSKRSQEQRSLWTLQAAWPQWTPAIALSRISLSYNSRIFSLRRAGWMICNRIEIRGGHKYGFFRLGSAPVLTSRERAKTAKMQKLPPISAAPQKAENLFGESLAPDRSYQE